ncbi:hypothetical protein SLE2022_106430 [Rubroshorea leprosula]
MPSSDDLGRLTYFGISPQNHTREAEQRVFVSPPPPPFNFSIAVSSLRIGGGLSVFTGFFSADGTTAWRSLWMSTWYNSISVTRLAVFGIEQSGL